MTDRGPDGEPIDNQGGAIFEAPPTGRLVVGEHHDAFGRPRPGQFEQIGVGRSCLVDDPQIGEPRTPQVRSYRIPLTGTIWLNRHGRGA